MVSNSKARIGTAVVQLHSGLLKILKAVAKLRVAMAAMDLNCGSDCWLHAQSEWLALRSR